MVTFLLFAWWAKASAESLMLTVNKHKSLKVWVSNGRLRTKAPYLSGSRCSSREPAVRLDTLRIYLFVIPSNHHLYQAPPTGGLECCLQGSAWSSHRLEAPVTPWLTAAFIILSVKIWFVLSSQPLFLFHLDIHLSRYFSWSHLFLQSHLSWKSCYPTASSMCF